MKFNKSYFEKYGQYRNDIKEIKRFKQFIFSSKRILWVGCSTGKGVKYLNQRNIDCIGVDINDYAISMSKIPNKLLKANILNLPFKNNEFDCVICIDLLEHLTTEQIPKALCELKRITSDKILVGVTPRERQAFYEDSTHVTGLSFDEWEELLDAQLPQRVDSNFHDARYAFSKKTEPYKPIFFIAINQKPPETGLLSFIEIDLAAPKEKTAHINSTHFNVTPQYITVKKHNKTIAFCPCFVFENEKNNPKKSWTVLRKLLGIVRTRTFHFDKMIAAYPISINSPKTLDKKDFDNIVELICRKLEEISHKKHLDLSVFFCRHNDTLQTARMIEQHDYKELKVCPNTKLANHFNSFYEYFLPLLKKHKKYIPSENNPRANICSKKTKGSNDLDAGVAMLKLHMWKARTAMNIYVSLLKTFY